MKQLRGLAKRRVLHLLLPTQRAACRRLLRDELSALPGQYPYPAQVLVYGRVKAELEVLLNSLQDVD